jgi:hypothetical protein
LKRLPLLALLLPVVAFAGGRVSHFKTENKMGANFYNIQAAIDGKIETAWMVPGESDNKGEWVEVDIPVGEVDKIAIYAGYGKNAETFSDFPRVKKMRVDVYGIDDSMDAAIIASSDIDIADKPEMQLIDVPDVKSGVNGGRVRLTVLDLYPGEDYPNLAVSEVTVMMKEIDGKAVIAAISGEMDGHGKDALQDDNPKTFWAAEAKGAGFTLTSTGFALSSVGFVPQGKDYARPKTVKISVGPVTKVTEFPDTPGEKWAPIPAFNGYNGGGFGDVEVEIVDVWPGTNPQVGLSELKVKATTYSPV